MEIKKVLTMKYSLADKLRTRGGNGGYLADNFLSLCNRAKRATVRQDVHSLTMNINKNEQK